MLMGLSFDRDYNIWRLFEEFVGNVLKIIAKNGDFNLKTFLFAFKNGGKFFF